MALVPLGFPVTEETCLAIDALGRCLEHIGYVTGTAKRVEGENGRKIENLSES